jgi:hypothetical protein
LKYFLFNADIPIHLRGLVREVQEEINAVRRELSRLEEIGFVRSEVRGNRKYFLLNRDFAYVDELLGIFHKSFGLGGSILKNLNSLGEVEFAVLTGSFTTFSTPDPNIIDLVMVGNIDIDALTEIVQEAEKKLNREINYTVLKSSEFILKKKRRDAFIMQLLMVPKIMLAGNINDLSA